MAVLPLDPVQLEQMLASAIRDTLLAVPLIAQYTKVEVRERFPDSDEDDIEISTVDDPGNSDLRFTSIIQVGMPKVTEKPYTSERMTQLDFEYPISFDMGVKDEWDNSDSSLDYTNSRALFMAIYMKARAQFAISKELGGFENCEHDYLQQDNVSTVEDEETGGRLHVADWTLVVHVKGVTV
jgi:hypothetical protein